MIIGVDVRPLGELRGGVYEYTRHLLSNLVGLIAASGEHTLLLVSLGAKPFDIQPHVGAVLGDKIKAVHIGSASKFYAAAVLAGASAPLDARVEQACGVRPDIFLCPNANFMSFSSHTPFVLTIHDASFELFPEAYTVRQRLWHRLVNIPRLMRLATRLIAVSKKTKEDICALYGLSEETISVIRLGADHCEVSSRDTIPPRERLRLPERYILGFGCENERKNMNACVRAFALTRSTVPDLADTHLVLVATSLRRWNETARVIRELGLSSRVQIRGPLSNEERVATLAHASLLVYPSLYEGFGLPPLEAAKLGTPVLASWAASIPEVSGSFSSLCDPFDVRSLARSMIALLCERDIRERCIQKGRDVAGAYTWERSARETLSLLQSV